MRATRRLDRHAQRGLHSFAEWRLHGHSPQEQYRARKVVDARRPCQQAGHQTPTRLKLLRKLQATGPYTGTSPNPTSSRQTAGGSEGTAGPPGRPAAHLTRVFGEAAARALEVASDDADALWLSFGVACLEAAFVPGTGWLEPDGVRDLSLEPGSRLVTLRPNWKDVPDATLCLAVVEGARSVEIPCKGRFRVPVEWTASQAEGRGFDGVPSAVGRHVL